jgi:hypothetical protein
VQHTENPPEGEIMPNLHLADIDGLAQEMNRMSLQPGGGGTLCVVMPGGMLCVVMPGQPGE